MTNNKCLSSGGILVETDAEGIFCLGPTKGRNICRLHPDKGHCKARILRYYYDTKLGDCYPFTYGGCGGNGNNFATWKKCLEYCKGKLYMNVYFGGKKLCYIVYALS